MDTAEKLNTIRKITLELATLVIRLKPEHLTPETQGILMQLCDDTRSLYSALSDEFYEKLETAHKDAEGS